MNMLITAGATIEGDGRVVWVNDTHGCCIGRFSKLGVDVHQGFAAQMRGETQCLDCFHEGEPPTLWARFKASMLKHHGIKVPDDFRPRFVGGRGI